MNKLYKKNIKILEVLTYLILFKVKYTENFLKRIMKHEWKKREYLTRVAVVVVTFYNY